MPETQAPPVKQTVDALFARLGEGKLTQPPTLAPEDGWRTALPGGTVVARSALQREAHTLVALGPDAVPHLLPWVRSANPALCYVAVFALGEITGEHPHVGYFDAGGDREGAIAVWRAWYDAHHR